MKLECSKCQYKFEKDEIPSRCPYCGNDGTISKRKTAQDILNEVTKEISASKKNRKERLQS